jgi:CRISPR-associated protein Csm2
MANAPYQRGPRREGGPRRDDHRGGRPPGGGPRKPCVPDIDVTGIRFSGKLHPELFSETAKRSAEKIGSSDPRLNKPTQLRRFYDELTMWVSKVDQGRSAEKSSALLEEYLPFVRMLNAKAAYAEGRELVDCNFVRLLEHCLKEVVDPTSLRSAKLFFEAFLGFYKEVRPKDN